MGRPAVSEYGARVAVPGVRKSEGAAVMKEDTFYCEGYRMQPQPECRWPGEESCGPGCTRGVEQ